MLQMFVYLTTKIHGDFPCQQDVSSDMESEV